MTTDRPAPDQSDYQWPLPIEYREPTLQITTVTIDDTVADNPSDEWIGAYVRRLVSVARERLTHEVAAVGRQPADGFCEVVITARTYVTSGDPVEDEQIGLVP